MSRKLQPLPEYQALVRWSVQEVVNWLSQNGMNDCMKSFRHGGVDGNKLVNVTVTDLNTINCPKRHIRDIMQLVSQVPKPGMKMNRGGGGWRQPAQRVPPNEQTFGDAYPSSRTAPAQSYEGSASGSEDEAMWDDDEFDNDYASDESYESPVETSQPTAPPRPSRGLPGIPPSRTAVPQRQPSPQFEPEEPLEEFYEDPDNPTEPIPPVPRRPPVPIPNYDGNDGEDYEDPDKAVHIQNFHAGPLPTPPTVNRQRQPPPSPGLSRPARPGGPSLPSRPGGPTLPNRPGQGGVRGFPAAADSNDGEDYEEPDNTMRPPPPPVSSVPSFKHKAPAIVPDDQEEYEEPDVKPRPPPISSVPSFKHKPPPPPTDGEDYEEPDAPINKPRPPPLGQRKPPPPPVGTMQSSKTNQPPPVPSNVPTRKPSLVPVVQEETYEVLDDDEGVPKSSKQPPHPKCPLPAVPATPSELYEVPESNNNEMEPNDANEDYLVMEEGDSLLDKVSSMSPKVPAPRAGNGPRRPVMPLAREKQSVPTHSSRKPPPEVELQETYEIPDQDDSKDGGAQMPEVTNGGFLHGHRSDRALPRPPASVPQPKKEPARTHATSSTDETNTAKEFSENDLLRQRWYHGSIARPAGDVLLNKYCQDGMYLIRKSSQGGDKPYTLQIYFEGKIYNLPIRRKTSGQFALGKDEKPNEKTFDSLLKLVNAFKTNTIVLAGGKQTKLVKSLPKT